MKKTAEFAVLFAVLSVGLYQCSDNRPAGANDSGTSGRVAGPVSGGRMTVAYRSEPKTFNRLVSPQIAEELVARLTQATLVRLNRKTGELEPRLAREWTSSPDGLTWTLTLVDGVTFSDGTPFTSADVVFTFQALFDPKVKSQVGSSLLIKGKSMQVRAIDASRVAIVLPAPYGPGLSMLDAVPILPRHKLAAALEAGTFRDAWSVTTPVAEMVGLGPFVIQEYLPGQKLVFARNPKYWEKDAEGRALPYLDGVELQFVPDQNAEVLRLQAGQIDAVSSTVRFEDLAALKDLEKAGKVSLHDAGASIAPDMLWFNLNPGAKAAQGRPWLQRDELRQAISAAVDRKAIVNTVFLGEASEIAGPITAGHKQWFLPDLRPPAVDAAAAAKLLTSIDLKDRNGDGLVDDAKGKTATVKILTAKGNTVRERTLAMIREQLRRPGVGLDVDVAAVERGAMIEAWGKGDYDAIYFAVESDSFDPARNPEFWQSSGMMHFWNPSQKTPATTWEAKIDDLMTKQSTSMNADERQRLFAEAQRIFAKHEPVLYFAAPKVILATSARVHGTTPSVLAPYLLWNAERLFVANGVNARR